MEQLILDQNISDNKDRLASVKSIDMLNASLASIRYAVEKKRSTDKNRKNIYKFTIHKIK